MRRELLNDTNGGGCVTDGLIWYIDAKDSAVSKVSSTYYGTFWLLSSLVTNPVLKNNSKMGYNSYQIFDNKFKYITTRFHDVLYGSRKSIVPNNNFRISVECSFYVDPNYGKSAGQLFSFQNLMEDDGYDEILSEYQYCIDNAEIKLYKLSYDSYTHVCNINGGFHTFCVVEGNPNNGKCYLDGVLVKTMDTALSACKFDNVLNASSYSQYNASHSFRVYSKALTANEVMQNYLYDKQKYNL